ncbi:MAG TPA: hypothetical protein VNH19_02140 [Candidatus Limnocylindrales bacterium]|jgi:hypothetical protein|nr:hypothetical protein [Candidatus Limnocylindrales bacterium]
MNSAAYRTLMSHVECTSKPIQVEFTKSIVVDFILASDAERGMRHSP